MYNCIWYLLHITNYFLNENTECTFSTNILVEMKKAVTHVKNEK